MAKFDLNINTAIEEIDGPMGAQSYHRYTIEADDINSALNEITKILNDAFNKKFSYGDC